MASRMHLGAATEFKSSRLENTMAKKKDLPSKKDVKGGVKIQRQ